MLENLNASVRAMIGPWIHTWPHEPYPGPGMEWCNEAARWYDQWRKGKGTGIMDEHQLIKSTAIHDLNHEPGGQLLQRVLILDSEVLSSPSGLELL